MCIAGHNVLLTNSFTLYSFVFYAVNCQSINWRYSDIFTFAAVINS